jgi:predicted DNA-binding ribbon-helix-helix protein
MSKEKMTAVSIRSNDAYLAALKELARRKKTTMGDLVKEALDAKFGKELSPLVSFFILNGNTDDHSVAIVTGSKP